MKKILILSVLLSLIACTSEEDKQKARQAAYYLDEDFVIINTSTSHFSTIPMPSSEMYWLVERVTQVNPDSIEVAELSKEPVIGTFAISKELWYNKKIGDTLHFEYILKERFFKVAKKKIQPEEKPVEAIAPTEIGSVDKIEMTMKKQELERQLMEINDKLK